MGFSFLMVLTKEKIRIAFYKFLCWENTLRRETHVGKETLGGMRLLSEHPTQEQGCSPQKLCPHPIASSACDEGADVGGSLPTLAS